MNKKIYFNNRYILITPETIQPTGNQLIVNAITESGEYILRLIHDFIQQTDASDLIFICKNVNSFFETLKQQFVSIEAAGGLIKQDDKYLFIYRLNTWDLPKGKIDKGESPRHAAIRECEEECAIKGLDIVSELPTTYHIYPYKNRFALKTTYWFLMTSKYSGTLIPQTEENIEKVEWLNTENIKNTVLPNTYPSIIDLILPITDNKK